MMAGAADRYGPVLCPASRTGAARVAELRWQTLSKLQPSRAAERVVGLHTLA